jgi:hypothetical protein
MDTIDRARLRALEELMTDLLRRDPVAMERLWEEANEPIRYAGDGVSAKVEYQETVQAAKRRLLTRAMHPGGLLAEGEVDDEA